MLSTETVVTEGSMEIRVQRDLLGAVLQSHTQPLLEGEDLLQVPTQGGAVCTAHPEYTYI